MTLFKNYWVKYKRYFEAIVWIAGLTMMAISDPFCESHYSLCLFKNMGFSFCPGCGLGHAIGYLARGEFLLSFKSHPLGIFAILMLSYRIFQIFSNKPIRKHADEQDH